MDLWAGRIVSCMVSVSPSSAENLPGPQETWRSVCLSEPGTRRETGFLLGAPGAFTVCTMGITASWKQDACLTLTLGALERARLFRFSTGTHPASKISPLFSRGAPRNSTAFLLSAFLTSVLFKPPRPLPVPCKGGGGGSRAGVGGGHFLPSAAGLLADLTHICSHLGDSGRGGSAHPRAARWSACRPAGGTEHQSPRAHDPADALCTQRCAQRAVEVQGSPRL